MTWNEDATSRAIGQRLREARLAQHKTLQAIASHLGVSYQQVRKYESGENRISASMLYRAACALDVDVALFFAEPASPDAASTDSLPASEPGGLADALRRIDDPNVRQHLANLIALLKTND